MPFHMDIWILLEQQGLVELTEASSTHLLTPSEPDAVMWQHMCCTDVLFMHLVAMK